VKVTNTKPKSIAILQITGLSGSLAGQRLIWRWGESLLGLHRSVKHLRKYLWFEVTGRHIYLKVKASVGELVRRRGGKGEAMSR